jgi:hypothetical protein
MSETYHEVPEPGYTCFGAIPVDEIGVHQDLVRLLAITSGFAEGCRLLLPRRKFMDLRSLIQSLHLS